MPMPMLLVIAGSIGALAAAYYAFLLSKETGHEKYWLAMSLAALLFAMHQLLLLPWEFAILDSTAFRIAEETLVILSSLLFGYSARGLYKAMAEVRRRVE